jgi:hypothetical protein
MLHLLAILVSNILVWRQKALLVEPVDTPLLSSGLVHTCGNEYTRNNRRLDGGVTLCGPCRTIIYPIVGTCRRMSNIVRRCKAVTKEDETKWGDVINICYNGL